MISPKIHGMEKVLSNLNKEIRKLKAVAPAGLLKSAMLIRRDMDKTPPKIPVDTGNLRSSWFTDLRSYYFGISYELRFGFTASYAWEVHEKVGSRFRRPGAGAKFMEASIKRNSGKILDIMIAEAKKQTSLQLKKARGKVW